MRIWRLIAVLLACALVVSGCQVDEVGGTTTSVPAPLGTGDSVPPEELDLGGVDPATVQVTDDDQALRYQDTGVEPSAAGIAAARHAVARGLLLDADQPGSGLQVLHDLAAAERLGAESTGRQQVSNEWFGLSRLAPGVSIDIPADGDSTRCTLAFLGSRRGVPFAISAGHCTEDAAGWLVWQAGPDSTPQPVGPVVAAQNRDRSLDDGMIGTTDYSLTEVGTEVPLDGRIAGRYTVTSVLQPEDIHPGMTLCSFGYRTEETCGQVISSNATMVRAAVYSLGGDSGAPAYLKLDDTHVAAVGILSGSPVVDGEHTDDVTDFALLAPVLAHSQVTVAG